MMKRNFLIFAAMMISVALFPVIANAQFAKADWMVEGGLGSINISKTDNLSEQNGATAKNNSKDFSINVSPRAGYFITNNLVIGTTFGIGYGSSKFLSLNSDGSKNYETKTSATNLELVPFVRYYFSGKNAGTRFYAQAGGGISLDLSSKYDSKNFNTTGNVTSTYKYNYPKKMNAVTAEALLGLNHFVSQNVAVNAGLGYKYNRTTRTITSTTVFGNVSNTTDPIKYTSKTNAFIWNVGFTMILHCKKKK